MYLLGMTSERAKDYTGAVKWLEASSSSSLNHPDSLHALARSYYQLGNKVKARAALNQLSQTSAGPTAVFLGCGIASQAGDFEMAERMLQSIATTFPDPSALKQALASVRFKTGRYREARLMLLDLVNTGTSDGAVYNLLAWCYWREGNPGDAFRDFERAIAVVPFAETNYLDYSKVLQESGHLQEALKTVKQGVEKLPDSASLQEHKGDIETKMGLHREAIQSYGKVVRLNPSSPAAFIGLGLAQANDLQTDAAIETFEKAVKRFPRNGLVYQEFGRMLLIPWVTQGSPGSESRAVVLLRKAIELDPSLAEADYQLGNLLLQKESIDEALDLLKTAARLDPKSSKVHFALERAYRKLGQTEEVAREHELFEKLKAAEEKSGRNLSPTGRGN
jgi:tetratricopeptide (TPR) repeat protein